VQYPEYKMNSTEQLEMIPVTATNGTQHLLSEVASWKRVTMPGEYDRINQQRSILITANVIGKDLGGAFKKVRAAIAGVNLPKGGKILLRGQADLLDAATGNLQSGLLIAVAVICLLMAVFFQSFVNAFIILSVIPAVTTGSLLLLWLTGNTMNIQSYTGCIMAIGVSIANVVLYMTQAERLRKYGDVKNAYSDAAAGRLRPILMTSVAMIAGMLPMAIGFGESGAGTAPLGIAVIGGLLFSLISVLFFIPFLYRVVQGRKPYVSPSLDPDDENSAYK
jgi:multidrug efflux pump subunit AcrB